ncbi:MAG: S8 family serine peptidase, partial [Acidimicrobiales bacterium]
RTVAAVDGVEFVHEELTPVVGSAGRPTGGSGAPGAVTADPVCNPVVSEGVAPLRADSARATDGVDGTGGKVGILSDSFNGVPRTSDGIADDELPGTGNPCGHTVPVQVLEDETQEPYVLDTNDGGRTLAEIVHDVAPGASLAFATTTNGSLDFAANIRKLAAAGAEVIIDDVQYVDEPMYQDGNIAKAVDDVTEQGVTYLSAAGDGNTLDINGQGVGSYEAVNGYRPMPCPHQLLYGDFNQGDVYADDLYQDCYNFDPVGASATNTITVDAMTTVAVSLGWDEPEWNVPTDLDLWVIDDHIGMAISGSADSQDQTFAANEVAIWNNDWGSPHAYRMLVGRYKNPLHPTGNQPRFKMVNFHEPYQWSYPDIHGIQSLQFPTTDTSVPDPSTTFGHSVATRAGTVAADPYDDPTRVEDYSSRGPGIHCWAPVTGTLVASPRLTPCQKKTIDVTATDRNQTTTYWNDFDSPRRYRGTGASAAHAAGVAALQRAARPCAAPSTVLSAQRTTAHPIGTYGADVQGAGLLDAAAAIAAMPACAVSPASTYHAVNPTRVLEPRNIPGHTGGYTTPWGPGVSRSLDVTDTNGSGVPDTGVSAVVLNVTATDTSSSSFLSVYPDGEPVPVSSNLNWAPGTTIANLVTVRVGTGGKVDFYNALGTVNVIADVVGWYDDGTPIDGKLYTPTTPTRILESRPISGNIGGYTTPWPADTTRTLDVTGSTTGVVPVGASAVVLNVTVTDTTTGGFLTVFPADVTTVPTASNINWSPHRTIPNLVTVRLGTGSGNAGKIKIYNAVGSANVIADVVGYYGSTGSKFHALSPARVLDSRFGNGEILGTWGSGQTRDLDVTQTGLSGVPATGVQAVAMNVTVTDTSSAGFLTLFPADIATVPNASNLNWATHDTIPNLTITRVPTSGSDHVRIYNQVGTTNVIADVVGWFG